jgi:N-succinyl-L-ornithine transcarbamylase
VHIERKNTMIHFRNIHDCENPLSLIDRGLYHKSNPFAHQHIGKNKTIGLIFFNPSLRTRLSTQKAAFQLGLNTIIVNITADSWALEFADGSIMNTGSVEHIKDAAAMLGIYCDLLAIRVFPSLQNKNEDYAEPLIEAFVRHARIPVISLESATVHPLQSLADMMSIKETSKQEQPKIILTWAPHIKPLPQSVPNSFAEWALKCFRNLTIVQPPGYELSKQFTKGATIEYDRKKALEGADFIYVKNWSSFEHYGSMPPVEDDWLFDNSILHHAPNAKVMHCLPVRRNLEITDEVLDSPQSIIHLQAENRIYAAQAVLHDILESMQ